MSYLRALLITDPLIILATIVMGSISVIASFFDPEGRVPHRVACCWARMLLRISGVRVRLEGAERILLDGCYVFVSNHASLMDTPVVLATIPVPFLFLAKIEYFRIPFLGTHLRRAGHLPVVLNDIKTSLKSMTHAARAIRQRHVSVLLFPEGTRSTGPLMEFKEGAAYIAIKAGVPLVPMAIIGTRQVLPVGSIHVRGGRVEVRLGEPIETRGLSLANRAQLTELTRARIAELLGESQRIVDHSAVMDR